jgi:hypothetical protein
MRNGDPDPNKKYRPWLEEHVGKQFREWNWKLSDIDSYIIEIMFKSKESALFFELTWA